MPLGWLAGLLTLRKLAGATLEGFRGASDEEGKRKWKCERHWRGQGCVRVLGGGSIIVTLSELPAVRPTG